MTIEEIKNGIAGLAPHNAQIVQGGNWSGQQPIEACPTCGHCPHCGRGGFQTQPYPQYPRYPSPMWISSPGTVYY